MYPISFVGALISWESTVYADLKSLQIAYNNNICISNILSIEYIKLRVKLR